MSRSTLSQSRRTKRDPQAIVDRFAAAITAANAGPLLLAHPLHDRACKLPVRELCALGPGARLLGGRRWRAGSRRHAGRRQGARLPRSMPPAATNGWCGPKGTGFLYLSEEMSGALDALPLAAGRSANSDSTGIVNIAGLRGLGAAIDFIAAHRARTDRGSIIWRFCAELHEQLSRLNQICIPGAGRWTARVREPDLLPARWRRSARHPPQPWQAAQHPYPRRRPGRLHRPPRLAAPVQQLRRRPGPDPRACGRNSPRTGPPPDCSRPIGAAAARLARSFIRGVCSASART